MAEDHLIAALQLVGGLALFALCACRINQLQAARFWFTAAYIMVGVSGLGMALAAGAPRDRSDWPPVILLYGILLLLLDTRSRWRGGPPIDSGSRT